MYILESIKQFEATERRVMDDFYRHAPETTRRQIGLETIDVGNARLYLAARENNILLNRVLGLGSTSPMTEQDLIQVLQAYAGRGIDQFFVMIQPWLQPARAWNWLFDQGFGRDRGWTLFFRNPQPASPVNSSLRIEAIGPEHARDFARIVANGFDLSRHARPALEALVGKPGWYHFMSFSGDRPAGAAALFVEDGFAWFDWAATDPEFRARGSQSALLHARIEKALELGCHAMGSETGEAVPGDPQHSFNNLMRAGFVPTYTRDNFSTAATQYDSVLGQVEQA
jgi:GNAT superfamily N-acetyltransferase